MRRRHGRQVLQKTWLGIDRATEQGWYCEAFLRHCAAKRHWQAETWTARLAFASQAVSHVRIFLLSWWSRNVYRDCCEGLIFSLNNSGVQRSKLWMEAKSPTQGCWRCTRHLGSRIDQFPSIIMAFRASKVCGSKSKRRRRELWFYFRLCRLFASCFGRWKSFA